MVMQGTGKPPKRSDPYWLDPTFEAGMVTLACCNPRFFGRIGSDVDGDCLGLEPAKLALKAAKAIAKDTHKGPEAASIVLQRLRKWMSEDGRVSLEQIKLVAEMFDDAYERGLPSENAAVTELIPILKRRLSSEAVDAAVEEYGQNRDFERTAKLIAKAQRLGDTNTSVGIRLGAGSYEEIDRLRTLERLPTGIVELDDALEGGLRRGQLGLFVGGSNDGKSMALSYQAAYAISCGLSVVYATLELSPADVLARTKATLTGMTINGVLADSRRAQPALDAMPLGAMIVQHFTPKVTTMAHIEDWFERCVEELGRVDVLITDYGDKLAPPRDAGREGEQTYGAAGLVFERMRIFAAERQKGAIWHWSASQAKRRQKASARGGKGPPERLDIDDLADSQHKARVADMVITLNYDEASRLMTWYVAKNRTGRSKVSIGPLPTEWETGRIAPWLVPDLT